MRRHLLVTNDFPPKIGGIQSYLWELWRRLDPDSFVVLTPSSDPDAGDFDACQRTEGVRIMRVPSRTLLFPTPSITRSIRQLAEAVGASFVVLDPAFPLGLVGPSLGLPYAVIVHGAEVTVPARLPISTQGLAHVLRDSRLAICAGRFPAAEVRRIVGSRVPVVEVPPGVDCQRFVPLGVAARDEARARFGVPPGAPLVVGLSRLVPRKGMDVLVESARRLLPSFPELTVLIGGEGRQFRRLGRLAALPGSPVRMLGGVAEDDLPQLIGAADVFVMACRTRWLGLEQEGFGIVFLEAAAASVPQIAGDSGGAAEAVEDGVTGFVVRRPRDPSQLAAALRRLLADEPARQAMGVAARQRACHSFDYARLAPRLAEALAKVEG